MPEQGLPKLQEFLDKIDGLSTGFFADCDEWRRQRLLDEASPDRWCSSCNRVKPKTKFDDPMHGDCKLCDVKNGLIAICCVIVMLVGGLLIIGLLLG